MAKVLILHASVGSGHKTAAQALEKTFNLRHVGQVWCEDALDYGSKFFKELYVGSYLELSERAPVLWAYFYESTDKNDTELAKDLRTLLNRVGVSELREMAQSRRPDAILCTHFLPLNLLAREKRKGRLAAPLYCVVTDYTGHVYWVSDHVDGYFVATPKAGELLAKRGVHEDIITITGIPIDPKIAQPKEPAQIRQTLQIEQAPVITLLGGGLNVERVRQMVTDLLQRGIKGTLIVVAGRNEGLQKALLPLRATAGLQVRILGFVDYLDDLIVASDLVITKPGGLIVSEILARHTPMLIVDPIPGQEEWNADYVVSTGAGVQVRLAEMAPLVVENLLNNPARLAALRTGAQQAGRPDAAFRVVDAVMATVET